MWQCRSNILVWYALLAAFLISLYHILQNSWRVGFFLSFAFFGLVPVSSSSSSSCFVRAAAVSCVPLENVCCFSCSLSVLRASHSSELSACCLLSSNFSYFSCLACFVVLSCLVRPHFTCPTFTYCSCFGFAMPRILWPPNGISLGWTLSTDTGCTDADG